MTTTIENSQVAVFDNSNNGVVATATTTTTSVSKNLVVDALPYIDAEYDEPGMKEMVSCCF